MDDFTHVELLYTGIGYIVYRARRSDGQPVVLKKLRSAYPSARALNRLRTEYALLQRIVHPNVVRVLTLGPSGNGLVMTAEPVPGIALTALMAEQPVELERFFAIALPLVAAVEAVHRQGIMHTNLSLANVLFEPESQHLTLVGFGRAAELPRGGLFPPTDEEPGDEARALSPEQTGRINQPLDYRTDLYGLGCLFYQLLTGQPPFAFTDPSALIHAHLALSPRSPGELRPELPPMLSDILLRLLAKDRDDRYQSAAGLLADLRRCQHAPDQARFPLGEFDVSDQFRLPARLYGRTAELERLKQAFEQARAGQTSSVFIGGYAGVGKSKLVREMQQLVVAAGGLFVSGKFDQFKRDIPLRPVLAAMSELIRQVLTRADDQISHWQHRTQKALGGSGQVLVDVIPELATLVGPQPPVPDLPLVEATNRFTELLNRLFGVFCQPDQPLCLFLDDLQWMDSATRQWIEAQLTGATDCHFLLLGAYRDTDVPDGHPLLLLLDRLARANVPVDRLLLAPLPPQTLGQLIADALKTTPDQCADLTEVIHQKTDGNPFFARQCLMSLYEEGAIYFAPDQHRWNYTLERVRQAQLGDNVVDLLTQLIGRLPNRAQRVLMMAACIGNQFDLLTLGAVIDHSPDQLRSELDTALQGGLVVPVRTWPTDALPTFAFQHDRVQQAARSLLTADEAARVHGRLGWWLLSQSPNLDSDDTLYVIADHLNHAVSLLTEAAQQAQYVDINLKACIRAKQSAAYELALRYNQRAMAMLPPERWETPSALTSELLLHRAECEHLCGQNAAAEPYFDQAVQHAVATLDKARIYQRQIHYYTNTQQFEQAYQTGRAAVRMLGVWLPARFSPPSFLNDLVACRLMLGTRPVAELINLKTMTDERLKMAVLLMATFARAAYQLKPVLCIAVCARIVRLCLQHGNTDGGFNGFLAYGAIFIGAILNQKKKGFEYGQLVLRLVDKFNSAAYRAETHFVVGYFAMPWQRPVAEMEAYWQTAYEAGLETGDLFHASCACCGTIQSYFMRGMPFDDILTAAARYQAFLERIGSAEARLTIQAVTQAISNLRGETASTLSYDSATFDEGAYRRELGQFRSRHFAHYYFINKMQALYLWGHYEQAYAVARESDGYLSDSPGMLHTAEHYFYKGLILCACYPQAPAFRRLGWLRTLHAIRQRFRQYTEGMAATFQAKYCLLDAEISRVRGNRHAAEAGYEAALRAARQYGYGQIEALAHMRLAGFHEQAARQRLAALHRRDAAYGFRRVGATALADRLLAADTPAPDELGTSPLPDTRRRGTPLDLATILKASEAIARAIRLPDLLATLMNVIIENAGGQRMVFVLPRAGELFVQAECVANAAPVQLPAAVPLLQYPQIAQTVVHYVARLQEPVVLANAAQQGPFTNDPYVQATGLRSVLCAPLLQQGNLVGVIYLENNLTTGAFTPDRIDLISLLSGQLAISVENALLYGSLEEKVAERTATLNQSLERLRATQDQLVQAEKMASLGELTAGIAHEIQNPLNFVNNFAEVSLELLDDLKQEQTRPDRSPDLEADLLTDVRKNMLRIYDNGQRVAAVVRGMLEHSRRTPGQRQLTDLNALANECLTVARQHWQPSRPAGLPLQVVTHFDAGLGKIEMVPQDMSRVLLNLYTNALYALAEQQKTADADYQPTLTVTTHRATSEVVVHVHDNGTGVPPPIRDKLFQPFFTTKPTGQGTGLGLSLSYDIVVKGHGGRLMLDRQNEAGTEFVLSLPLT